MQRDVYMVGESKLELEVNILTDFESGKRIGYVSYTSKNVGENTAKIISEAAGTYAGEYRKHVYQLMANELRISHVVVSLVNIALQLLVSLGFVWGCGALASYLDCSLVLVHWIYLICALVVLAVGYVAFKKKYYHLHEEYLASLKK